LRREVVDANEAVARVAHLLSEVIAIYPITPASAMGEYADEWSAKGHTNLWGVVPEVMEMQSEAGAAAALHGTVLRRAPTTTLRASQGRTATTANGPPVKGRGSSAGATA